MHEGPIAGLISELKQSHHKVTAKALTDGLEEGI